MIKKTFIRIAAAAGLTAFGIAGVSTVQAANPASFFHWAPATVPYTASTATRSVSFVARIPRNAFAPRDAQIDVTSISLGTNFNMEMLVACSNNGGTSGSKAGSWPLSSADDYTLQCPIFTTVTGVQGGLIILN
jgi:hypothetical protein